MERESKNNKLDVSIILVAYNEEHCVAQELKIIKESMDNSLCTYEIILVDDASKDRTGEIAEGFGGIKVIRHLVNKGSGGARKTGTLAAKGEIVVWTDLDMSYPNYEIPRLITEMKKNNFDQIVGARTSEKGYWKLLRAPAKYFIRKLASYLAEINIPDLNSGLRAFKREVGLKYINLLPKGFSCVSTMTLAFICNDHSVGFLPISYHKRSGRSKFHPIKDTQQYLLQVIRIVMYFNPLKIFLPISLFLFLIGVVSSIVGWLYLHKIIASNVIIILASIMIAILGLLADLIVAQHRR